MKEGGPWSGVPLHNSMKRNVLEKWLQKTWVVSKAGMVSDECGLLPWAPLC